MRMMNKKLIVGLFAVLVILTSIQSLRPVMAEPDNMQQRFEYFVVVVSGQGMICWSGGANGCTQSVAYVHVQDGVGNTLTFTATPIGPSHFTYWGVTTPPDKTSINPYSLSVDGNGGYITANFVTM